MEEILTIGMPACPPNSKSMPSILTNRSPWRICFDLCAGPSLTIRLTTKLLFTSFTKTMPTPPKGTSGSSYSAVSGTSCNIRVYLLAYAVLIKSCITRSKLNVWIKCFGISSKVGPLIPETEGLFPISEISDYLSK